MLGFPIVHDPLYNERDAKPRQTLGDWEHHPEVVGALDRMEEQLIEDEMVKKRPVETLGRMDEHMIPAEVLLHESEPATEQQVNNLQHEEGKWPSENIGECQSVQDVEPEEYYDVKLSEIEEDARLPEIEADARFAAGLSQLANYKYCLQCQAKHLLGTV